MLRDSKTVAPSMATAASAAANISSFTTETTTQGPSWRAPSSTGRNRLRTAVFGRAAISRESPPPPPTDRVSPPTVARSPINSRPRGVRQSPGGNRSTRSTWPNNALRSSSSSSSAGNGRMGEDWVDETALRSAMATAYETFALLHGPIQLALDAPVPDVDPAVYSGVADTAGPRFTMDSDLLSASQLAAAAAVALVAPGVEGKGMGKGCVVRGEEGEGEYVGRAVVGGGEVLRLLAAARKRLRKAKRAVDEVWRMT